MIKTIEVVDVNKKKDRGDIGDQSRRFEDRQALSYIY
jgi:hypothetical protein